MFMVAMAVVFGIVTSGLLWVAMAVVVRRTRAAAFSTQSLRYVRESIDEASLSGHAVHVRTRS
ncbi:MAG: hypothetical protein QOG87_2211 [Actinomycetota bacterium]|jgi:hypothetical protein